jgi:hypothetical protein
MIAIAQWLQSTGKHQIVRDSICIISFSRIVFALFNFLHKLQMAPKSYSFIALQAFPA